MSILKPLSDYAKTTGKHDVLWFIGTLINSPAEEVQWTNSIQRYITILGHLCKRYCILFTRCKLKYFMGMLRKRSLVIRRYLDMYLTKVSTKRFKD